MHYTRFVKAARTGPNAFTLEFENEEELRAEHRTNLAQRGLRLPVPERPALFYARGRDAPRPARRRGDGEGTVVAPLPEGVALHFEGDADALLAALLAPGPRPLPAA